MIQDPIRFPDCAVGLRVTHKFGGHGTVVDFAELASEPQVVPVDWDQPGRHPPRVPAASLTVAGDIPFADVCRTFGLRALIYRQTCLMLANGDVEAARASHTTHCSTWWDVCHFEQLTLRMAEDRKTRAEAALESSRLLAEEDLRKELERKSEARKRQQVSHGNEVEGLLRTGNFQGADSAYELNCKGFWSRSSYAKVRERYVKEHEAE
ncbi:MAG: hypothetical protein HYV17_04680, partial [Xanthomonadales bacterium]|nr:hypothetical protein [Xanthomonadales bacterium]